MFIGGITLGPGFQSVSGGTSRPYNSGALYWDHNSSCVKVLDPNSSGSAVSVYPSVVSISFDTPTMDAIMWAQRKMNEERRIDALCSKHPGLKDIKEQYEIMLALVQKEEKC